MWLSASLFGLYILVFYALAVVSGDMARWNRVIPMYVPGGDVGNAGIGLHFVGGALLLVLGSVQFVETLRVRAPALHRWSGRAYVLGALAAGIGGLAFVAVRGTVGGPWMDAGFGLYGVLVLGAAAGTVRHALARRLDLHRAWAIRLYALAIGSWLYRMDYGFWLLLTDGFGTAAGFRGPFDYFMDFAFYLPNLLVAEIFLRAPQDRLGPLAQRALAAVLLGATAPVLLGTYFFARYYWFPAMFTVLGT